MILTKKSFLVVASISGLLFLTSCLDTDTGVSDESKQFNRELKSIDDYLNKEGLDFEIDPNYGLRYFVSGNGNDTAVRIDNYVLVSYSGHPLNSTEIFVEKDSVVVNLAQQLDGWKILLPQGERNQTVTMFIPSYYGYGRVGNSALGVAPNTTLVYDVTVHKTFDSFTYQQSIIDAYLDSAGLAHQIDTVKELRYIVLEEGTGEKPTKTSIVNVSYKGYYLGGAEFDKADNVTFNLTGLISGWGILLPYIKEGGKIQMFLPARYAYGPNYYNGIPGNSILVFEVTLIDKL